MAVEARHLNLFPPQILCSRNTMMNVMEGTGNLYSSTGIGYGTAAAAVAPTTTVETLIPMYGSAMTDSLPAKTAATMKAADSGLTYALPAPLAAVAVSRKRSRDDNPLLSFAAQNCNQSHRSSVGAAVSSFTFLGEDISFQIQQQQLEIDRLIAQHNEKVRMEIEERRKRNSRRLIAAVEESVMKKLKVKEEEIEKINKLNWALEDRVKTLCVENQMWRDLAQMNEATGNALRSNLEQVLAQRRQHGGVAAEAALVDDAQSRCGSNFDEEIDRRTIANGAAEINGFWRTLADGTSESKGEWRTLAGSDAKSKGVVKSMNSNGNDGCVNGAGNVNGNGGNINRFCRSCGKEESCVLLLPCRHLCLCTICGSSLHVCPICKSTKTASLHVNF